MRKTHLKFDNVSFIYDSASEPLFENLSLGITSGWCGVAGPNGAGKTTLLKLAAGLLKPTVGHIEATDKSLYCPQRTEDMPDMFEEFVSAETKSTCIIKGRLGVCADWIERWDTLSQGERKRAQLAVALWQEPELLAVDEPTNHLDSNARQIIAKALSSFNGIGLLVSHDRELLDSLCKQCILIESSKILMRPGGITETMKTAKTERQYRQKQRLIKQQTYKKLKNQSVKRRELARQSQRRRSKKGISKKDHDAREKIDRARVTGKDGVGGRLRRQLKGRLAQTYNDLQTTAIEKEYQLGIWLPGGVSKRNFLWEIPAGAMSLGKSKQLNYPDLSVRPKDRIALTGPNGSGKSTLIRKMVDSLSVPEEHVTYVPQEIYLSRSQNILEQAQSLSGDKLGYLMTIVSRLGSRPERFLESTEPSPGETRKLLLALGMTRLPHIIIMDEPTNHMDLPSIECLQKALADCPCSLILVSHDRRFLQKLTNIKWHIKPDAHSSEAFTLNVL